jgi:hypothetical protein
MKSQYAQVLLFLLATLPACQCLCAAQHTTVAEDRHVKCQAWSTLGECESNAGYMLESCATSCHEYEEALAATTPKDLYR